MSLEWLDGTVTTVAHIWRLEREDGVAMGFTTHDKDLVADNFRYRAAPGMIPSTIALSDGLDTDNVEIEGAMTAAAITESDLMSGRWNSAQLSISLINWEDPEEAPLPLISGEFGEIMRSGEAFRAEMLGPTSFLDEAVAPFTSPTCRARFGDKHCKLSLHRYQAELTVSGGDREHVEFGDLSGQAGDYAFGDLTWLDGNNCGQRFAIMSGTGDTIILADLPSLPIEVGDRALLTAGCNKNFSTCRDRFNNGANFRGEPYLPGNDLLTRYPGA